LFLSLVAVKLNNLSDVFHSETEGRSQLEDHDLSIFTDF